MITHAHNMEEYKSAINNDKVLVDFFATWCGPCRMLIPVIEEIDEEGLIPGLVVVKIDVDECPDIARLHGIQSIPTLITFSKGEKIKTSLGYMNKNQLLAFLK